MVRSGLEADLRRYAKGLDEAKGRLADEVDTQAACTNLSPELDFWRCLVSDKISGECLCGQVEYSIENDFAFLLFCHCEQCRRIAGSAHASNLFSATDSLTWERGREKVKQFHHPSRDFTKAFCSVCGSGLPYKSSGGKMVIVPAGSLRSEPKFTKAAKVFLSERTDWTPSDIQFEEFQKFPSYFSV